MINALRHLEVFDPELFEYRVDIIGVGAIGSRVAIDIAKLGIKNIHIWDFDKVESHNIPNQIYDQEDIGKYKADAMAEHMKKATGISPTIHKDKVEGKVNIGEVVFVMVDSMKSRKEIFTDSIKLNLKTKLLIEARMGADFGRIYAIDPNDSTKCKYYEETLYGDDEVVDVSVCRNTTSVGPTASFISSMANWELIKWTNIVQNVKGSEEITRFNEIMFSLRPEPNFFKTEFPNI